MCARECNLYDWCHKHFKIDLNINYLERELFNDGVLNLNLILPYIFYVKCNIVFELIISTLSPMPLY